MKVNKLAKILIVIILVLIIGIGFLSYGYIIQSEEVENLKFFFHRDEQTINSILGELHDCYEQNKELNEQIIK